MKVLMFTQKVDRDDDLLGVYHEWIKRLAEKVEKLSVVCLYEGSHSLPPNVKVYSLGKEKGAGRIKYLRRFYRYVWNLRRDYDSVFVHMNTEYVLLGWWLWKLWNKKIILWFAHYRPDWKLRFSEKVVDKIVTSVPEACNIPSEKVIAIGQGIFVDQFKQLSLTRRFKAILFLGRISPIKNIEVLLEAFNQIGNREASLTIVGSPTPVDKEYFARITAKMERSPFRERIHYRERVLHHETVELYNQHELFVNLTPTGSFDKTILEAMACETPVIISNKAYVYIFPKEFHDILLFKEQDASDLAKKITAFFSLSQEVRVRIGKQLRDIIVKNHSIDHLVGELQKVFSAVL